MRLSKIIVLAIILISTNSCKKEYEYRINIVNKTGCRINNLVIQGKTDYKFCIENGGETGEFIFEWEGARTNWFAGEYYFNFFVASFSDTDSTSVTDTSCSSGITIKDLSMNKLNHLKLTKEDLGQSTCKHIFKIDFE